jgi:hypothetical protein|tara:strand:+ start:414 stop:857 length:444 start_codon:yes stop_codon:yes gene_type:complete
MSSNNNSGLVLNCTAAFAAAAPIATVISCTMQTSPTTLGVTEMQVPLTESWIATDVYVLAVPALATPGAGFPTAVNPVISFDKNRGRQLVQTPPLSAMLITSNTRPRFSPNPIGFEGGSIIRMFATSTVLNAAAISNVQFSVAISIV